MRNGLELSKLIELPVVPNASIAFLFLEIKALVRKLEEASWRLLQCMFLLRDEDVQIVQT